MDERTAQLIDRVAQWAKARDDVVGLALAGSHARDSARPDSDVDLLLVVERPDDYLHDTSWTGSFGPIERLVVEDWGAVTSLRVHSGDGMETEFGITSPRWAATDPVDPGTARVVRDGFRILLDRDGLLAELISRTDVTRRRREGRSRRLLGGLEQAARRQ